MAFAVQILDNPQFSWLKGKFADLGRLELSLLILIPLLFAGFFFLPTGPHRILLYLSYLVFAAFAYKERKTIRAFWPTRQFFIPLGLFLGYFAVSSFWSFDADVERMLQKMKVAPFILLFCLMLFVLVKKRPGFWRVVKDVFVLSALVTGVFLILSNIHLFWEVANGKRLEGWGRAENSVQCGLLYGLALIIFYSTRIHVLAFMNTKAAKILIGFVFVTVMVLSVSRGPLLALLMVYGSWLLLKRDWKKILVLGVLGLVGLGFLLTQNFDFANLAKRADGGRLQVWAQVFEKLDDKPVLGFGAAHKFRYDVQYPNRVESVPHPHSLYFSTMMQGGAIGILFLFACIGLILLQGHRVFRQDGDQSALLILLMGLFFGLFDTGGAYTNFSSVWLLFWVPFAVLPACHDLLTQADKDHRS